MICRTKKEIETAIVCGLAEFLKDQIGESGTFIAAEAASDTIIVRIKGVLSLAEKAMVRNQEGRELIKELKQKVMERSRPLLEQKIRDVVAVEIADMHHSFDPVKDERIIVFTLGESINRNIGE